MKKYDLDDKKIIYTNSDGYVVQLKGFSNVNEAGQNKGSEMQIKSRNLTFRLYPSENQSTVLEKWLGRHCDLYNCALDHRREAYSKHGISVSYLDQQNELPDIKRELPDLCALGSQALQETLRRVDRAFKAFFQRVKQRQTPGYPRFKAKCRFDSFCYPGPAGWKVIAQGSKQTKLHIGNIGEIVMRGIPRVPIKEGEPRTLTVSRKGNKWYSTISVRYKETDLKRLIDSQQRTSIGIDAGCESLLYTSEGKPIENPRHLQKELKRLKHAQRELSRKKKDSRNRWKSAKKVGKIHQKISNRRLNYLHEVSSELVKNHSFIAMENLKLKNMTASAKGTVEEPGKNVKAKSGLNRSILDAGIGRLFKFIEYKAEEAGTRLEKVRSHGTSQECSCCGAKVPKSLSVRFHRCDCGFVVHRDHNAALNILARGLEQVGLERAEVWRAGVSLPVKHETATIVFT